ncbi:hypothetical protein ST37_11700 [Vibrio sp. qd031]|nr:hypothetical protein ST37_11700 [Vibrio sp. qd031]
MQLINRKSQHNIDLNYQFEKFFPVLTFMRKQAAHFSHKAHQECASIIANIVNGFTLGNKKAALTIHFR